MSKVSTVGRITNILILLIVLVAYSIRLFIYIYYKRAITIRMHTFKFKRILKRNGLPDEIIQYVTERYRCDLKDIINTSWFRLRDLHDRFKGVI